MRQPGDVTVTAYDYYGAFFAALADRGLRYVVCSPGSRSAPLALSVDAEERLGCWMQIDERAAGFFALGLAKARRTAVALICTSGSAAANFFPAVCEAFYDGVSLLVLTADRPPELRDRGAGQTIDQIHLYGPHVRWSADLPVAGEVDPSHAHYMAARALDTAVGPPAGPVHLNIPLREPVAPAPTPLPDPTPRPTATQPNASGPAPTNEPGHATAVGRGEVPAVPGEVGELVELVRGCEKGLLAVGPADLDAASADSLARLAARAGWPILADAASGLRIGRSGVEVSGVVVATGNHLAGARSFWEAHRPEVIVRVGHPTAARSLREGLAAWGAPSVLVDPQERWAEPTTVPARRWRSPPGALAAAALAELGALRPSDQPPTPVRRAASQRPSELGASLAERGGSAPGGLAAAAGGVAALRPASPWAPAWQAAEAAAQEAISAALNGADLLEAGVARTLGAALEAGSILYASNSMPVRDLDGFVAPRADGPRVVAHRGTNGIDGIVSAAAGIAASGAGRTVLLAGDLALLHDLGGLLAAVRLGLDLTIVVPNNNGGGIFSFLPIAEAVPADTFRRLFHTPHDADLAAVVGGLGATHRCVRDPGALTAALTDRAGVTVIEVPIDTAANVAQHRDLEQAVHAALPTTTPSP